MALRVVILQSLFIICQCFTNPSFSSTNHLHRIQASGSGRDELDAMKRLLERSWDTKTMGVIPSDAEQCAKEAHAAMMTASQNGKDMFFIDLLLPNYDIVQGSNFYDSILAVEFCIDLSNCLTGKTLILVRDEQNLRTVNRVLDARERDKAENSMDDKSASRDDDDNDDDDDDDVPDDTDSETLDIQDSSSSVETAVSAPEDVVENSVESFRAQLMSSWDIDADTVSDAPKNPPKESKPENKQSNSSSKKYRLSSLFGTTMLSQGADMVPDIVSALRENALPTDDEETIVIVSAISREEMIAVRSLAGKYRGQKRIIMFNCKLDPLPRELLMTETIYSFLPLIARPKDSDDGDDESPKIVVLRRYPRDWEVYIDVEGNGFEMIASTGLSLPNKKGPPMSWVTENVQRYLQRRHG